MGIASSRFQAFFKLATPLVLLGLPACSMGGLGSYNPSASLAYQGADTSTVQQEVRSSLGRDLSRQQKNGKNYSSTAKSSVKKTQTVARPAPKLDALEARDMINSYRIARGLKPLYIHPKLTQVAQKHSSDLAQRDEISHYGNDGSTPWTRVERTGYRPRVAAENVGTGQVSVKEVFKGWKESPSHNENLLLGDATHMGIALVHKPGSKLKTFWTLVLGSQLEDGVSPVASTQTGRNGG